MNSENICVFSILRQYAIERLPEKEITSEHYQAIISDLHQLYPRKKPTLAGQAQAITDNIQRAANSFQAVADGLKPEIKEIIMKVETKYFVNGRNINLMTLEEKIDLIKTTEDKIADLEKVEVTSKMIKKEITTLGLFLREAVELFDKS